MNICMYVCMYGGRYNHGHLVRCLVERGASLEIEESELSYTPLVSGFVKCTCTNTCVMIYACLLNC